MPFSQPNKSFTKGNLGFQITQCLYPGDRPCLFSFGHADRTGCPRHSPEIFSCAGRPGGLEANTWDFSWECCVFDSACSMLHSIRGFLILVSSLILHCSVQGWLSALKKCADLPAKDSTLSRSVEREREEGEGEKWVWH